MDQLSFVVKINMNFSSESGRRSAFSKGYMPHLRVVDTKEDAYLGVRVIDCPAQVPPGAEVKITMEAMYLDRVDYSALVPGCHFDILEGRKAVGMGRVLKVVSVTESTLADDDVMLYPNQKSDPRHITHQELDEITLEVGEVLAKRKIDGYQYNECLNVLRAKLRESLDFNSCTLEGLGYTNWTELREQLKKKKDIVEALK